MSVWWALKGLWAFKQLIHFGYHRPTWRRILLTSLKAAMPINFMPYSRIASLIHTLTILIHGPLI